MIYGGPTLDHDGCAQEYKVGDLVSISDECGTLAMEDFAAAEVGVPASVKNRPALELKPLSGLVVEIRQQPNISEPFYRVLLSGDAAHFSGLGTWFVASDMQLIS